jgi:prepilin-type N-terminal cleavage/methylation domain-containing protein
VSARLDARGFSLLEMLAALGVTAIVAAGAVVLVRSQSLAARTQMAQTDLNDEARGVVELMAREIRLAGYYPRCTQGAQWVVFTATTGVVAASPQSIRIQADLNENGTIDTAATDSEDVTYQYNSVDQKIERVVGGVTTDLATGVASADFGFQYYLADGTLITGTGAGGALTAAQALAIRRVAVRYEPHRAADVRTTNEARSSLRTEVLLRNRQDLCA